MGLTSDVAARYAGGALRVALTGVTEDLHITEIHLRQDKPLLITCGDVEHFVTGDGSFTEDSGLAYLPTRKDISVMLELLADYSQYAFQEELRDGYITVHGGHRVGLAGRCVMEDGRVVTLKNVTSLCFRVACEVRGCGSPVMKYLRDPAGSVYHTMLISPPGQGKTTLLRDIIRLLSYEGYTVGVADERGEISGKGEADLGPRADVIDGCPKVLAMPMLLRSMKPDIIAADELGRREEIPVIRDVMNAGIRLICTAHAATLDEAIERPALHELMSDGVFKRFIQLDGGGQPGRISAVYNELREDIYKRNSSSIS